MEHVNGWTGHWLGCWRALLMCRRANGKINYLWFWFSHITVPSTSPTHFPFYLLFGRDSPLGSAYYWLNLRKPPGSPVINLWKNGKHRREMRFRLLANTCRMLVVQTSIVTMVGPVLADFKNPWTIRQGFWHMLQADQETEGGPGILTNQERGGRQMMHTQTDQESVLASFTAAGTVIFPKNKWSSLSTWKFIRVRAGKATYCYKVFFWKKNDRCTEVVLK